MRSAEIKTPPRWGGCRVRSRTIAEGARCGQIARLERALDPTEAEAGCAYAFPPRKPIARRRFAARPRPARPSSIIAQVESSGTARVGGSGGSIIGGGGSIIGGGRGEYRGVGEVARNLAGSAEKNSGHITKNHLTKGNVACVEASPRARLGRRKPQRERIASAVGRADNPDRWADGQGYALVEDGAPLDTDLDGLQRFLGEVVAEVQIDRPGERDQRARRSCRNCRTDGTSRRRPLSRPGPRSGPAPQPRLWTRVGSPMKGATFVHQPLRPTASSVPRPSPSRGPPYGLFAPTPLTTRRLQLNITRRNFFVI